MSSAGFKIIISAATDVECSKVKPGLRCQDQKTKTKESVVDEEETKPRRKESAGLSDWEVQGRKWFQYQQVKD